jgi:4-carboxymuconolactone decarboxylase
MKLLAATIASLSLLAASAAQADATKMREDVRTVAPALEKYTQGTLLGDVWKRPGLAPRDRGIVTLAALIARNQTIEMPYYFSLALDNGVKPREISEIITHLAFYSGWGNAMSAVAVAKDVFAERKIGSDQLPAVTPTPLPLDEVWEAQRVERVGQQFGAAFPGMVQNTTDILFRDLWLRPDLAPRDRSLVTVSALIANGQVAQLTGHLNRAMDNGLTQGEAMPVAKDVFEKRPR